MKQFWSCGQDALILNSIFLKAMEYIVHNLEELDKMANHFVTSYLKSNRKVFFYGGIGAGKTTFIKLICAKLGVIDFTSSPTFALVNNYEINNSNLSVNHADLYRIEDPKEIYESGLYELLYDSDYFFVEWPEKIETFYDDTRVNVFFDVDDEEIRHLRVVIS